MTISFERHLNPNPTPDAEREEILKAPVFGAKLTDHQVLIVWEKDKGWHSAQVIPYGPIMMDPSAAVLHYGQEIFEGIKAYRHQDGSIWTFRPMENAKRMQRSAKRLALPELPTELFLQSLKELIAVDGAWVPAPVDEKTLYFRPFEIAAENFLGVRAAHRAEYRVIASPVGPYFTGGLKPVKIWIALDSARAGRHGTGEAKTGGNGHSNGNGHHKPQPESDKWNCSDKQRDLILKITDENKLDKTKVDQLAQDRFSKGVRALNKLEASGLIEELLEQTGQSKPRNQRFGQKAGAR